MDAAIILTPTYSCNFISYGHTYATDQIDVIKRLKAYMYSRRICPLHFPLALDCMGIFPIEVQFEGLRRLSACRGDDMQSQVHGPYHMAIAILS